MQTEALYAIFRHHPVICTDTRRLRTGDLFFALRGPSFNANAFAEAALQQGAAFAVVDDPALEGTPGCIVVPDALEALQMLARHHRRQLKIPVLAITGSNGKTTTKELITAVLRRKFKTHATTGNLNNHIGVPLTLLAMPADTEIAVIEMGANHQHEIASYCRIAEPTHGLITNCGKAHIEGFGGLEGVRKGKGELFDFIRETKGIIFRNADLDYLESMAVGIEEQIIYGTETGNYQGRAVEDASQFLTVEATLDGQLYPYATNLVGRYNLPNVLVAAVVGYYFGVDPLDIKTAIEGYAPDNSRSQWLKRGSNKIILDAYNANPSSMAAAIENFARLDAPNKLLWLGGMKEMGEAQEAEHRALVALADSTSRDWNLMLVGPEFEEVAGRHTWYLTAAEAAAAVRTCPPENATILIKGSRGSRMETLLQALPEAWGVESLNR